MRLVEGEPEPDHPGALAPARHDVLTVRALEIKMAQDAELARVLAHRLDSEGIDWLAERTRRVDHCAIDAGRGHLAERIVGRVGRNLAMLRAHLAVLPKVDLGIDD